MRLAWARVFIDQADALAPFIHDQTCGKGYAMKPSHKPIVLDAEPDEMNLIIEEIENLIAGAEARIARQQEYVRSVASDLEGSTRAITDLERMTSSLDMLKRQRARIVRWEGSH